MFPPPPLPHGPNRRLDADAAAFLAIRKTILGRASATSPKRRRAFTAAPAAHTTSTQRSRSRCSSRGEPPRKRRHPPEHPVHSRAISPFRAPPLTSTALMPHPLGLCAVSHAPINSPFRASSSHLPIAAVSSKNRSRSPSRRCPPLHDLSPYRFHTPLPRLTSGAHRRAPTTSPSPTSPVSTASTSKPSPNYAPPTRSRRACGGPRAPRHCSQPQRRHHIAIPRRARTSRARRPPYDAQ